MFLVILISKVRHSVDVDIDSLLIKPSVEKWGWKLYKKSVDGLENIANMYISENRLVGQN